MTRRHRFPSCRRNREYHVRWRAVPYPCGDTAIHPKYQRAYNRNRISDSPHPKRQRSLRPDIHGRSCPDNQRKYAARHRNTCQISVLSHGCNRLRPSCHWEIWRVQPPADPSADHADTRSSNHQLQCTDTLPFVDQATRISRINCSEISFPNVFQVFHPMGGRLTSMFCSSHYLFLCRMLRLLNASIRYNMGNSSRIMRLFDIMDIKTRNVFGRTFYYSRKKASIVCGCFLGAPWGIRTHDLLIRSQTLYPAELRAHVSFSGCCSLKQLNQYSISPKKKQGVFSSFFIFF